MLKRPITYTDFEGRKQTEDFYFNISMSEIIKLQLRDDEGFQEYLERIVKTMNKAALIEEFQKIILLAYGRKSEDGKSFVKNDELREAFSMTAAYDQLFTELATDDGKAADFVLGAFPAELTQAMKKDQDKPIGPPPTPKAPQPPMPPTVR